MHDSFGARMRQHRQERQIALRAIAEQTKIKLSLLEDLERDDISRWPAGIFRRAYLRSYATAIGLDPDFVVREFLEIHPDAPEPVESSTPAERLGSPPTRLRNLFGSALGRLRRQPESDLEEPRELGGSVPPASKGSDHSASPPAPPASASGPFLMRPQPGPVPPPELRITPEPTPAIVPAATSGRMEAPVPDLLAAARICTDLGRVERVSEVPPLLREAAKILGATGLIVWVWDAVSEELRPALSHGYPEKILSQLRGVARDADNLTASAFRSGQTLAVAGTERRGGALAIPLLSPGACAGVLAIELPRGSEEAPTIRAVATFFAAMLAQLVGSPVQSADAPEASEHPEPVDVSPEYPPVSTPLPATP